MWNLVALIINPCFKVVNRVTHREPEQTNTLGDQLMIQEETEYIRTDKHTFIY
jgi:hypothetical protein